jgi:hypothetical protein
MKEREQLKRMILPVAFFGGVIGLLAFQDTINPATASTILIIDGPTLNIQMDEPKDPYPSCTENTDCPLPTTFCSQEGKCAELTDPKCRCSQKQVLRCFEDNGRARHIFCPEGCFASGGGTICR